MNYYLYNNAYQIVYLLEEVMLTDQTFEHNILFILYFLNIFCDVKKFKL